MKVSFLMVGHTHEDVDQLFSRISSRIRRLNVPTLQDLLQQIPKAYLKHNTTAERLAAVFNVRDWLSPSIEVMQRHSKPHVFKITKDESGRAVLMTKMWSTSAEWQTPTGSPYLLSNHPDGQPDMVRPDFSAVDLLRLTRQIEKLSHFLPEAACDQWKDTLEQLHEEESGKYWVF